MISGKLFVAILPICFVLACQTTGTREDEKLDSLDVQLGVVASFLDGGTPDRALRELEPIMEAHPKDARVQNMMGLVQLSLRNTNRAIVHFKSSYAIDQKISTALNLSAAYIEVGKFAEAERLLKKIDLKKESPPYQHPERVYHNLGLVYEKTNRLQLAERNYKRALEENPIYYLSKVQLARLYEKTRRVNLAITTMEQARATCPVCFDPVADLVRNYVKTKNSEKAQKVISSYVKTEGVHSEDLERAKKLQKDFLSTISKR